MKNLKGNRAFLYIGLPVAVVLPLLFVSFLIGPSSIYFWAGVGLGMLIMNYWPSILQSPQKESQPNEAT